LGECYIQSLRSINLIKKEEMLIWVTLKSIEEEEKWVQRKEELVKEIKENN